MCCFKFWNYLKFRNVSPLGIVLVACLGLALLLDLLVLSGHHICIIGIWFLNILASSIIEETLLVEMRIWCSKIGSVNIMHALNLVCNYISSSFEKEISIYGLDLFFSSYVSIILVSCLLVLHIINSCSFLFFIWFMGILILKILCTTSFNFGHRWLIRLQIIFLLQGFVSLKINWEYIFFKMDQ